MLEKYLSKYDFRQLKEYIEKLKPEIISEEVEEEKSWITTINIKLKSGIDLKVIIMDKFNDHKSWISFYLKKDSTNIEKLNL